MADTSLMNKPLAVITGASSGIGKELANIFATEGYDLIIVAEDPGIKLVGQVFQAKGSTVYSYQIDLASYEGVQEFYNKIKEHNRPVDVIAINAGVGLGDGFANQKIEDVLNLINLNVTSSVHLAKLALNDMVKRNSGKILFTSSIAATMPGPFEAVYSASKAFIQSFAEAIRNELKDTDITVTALQPGPTETNFFHRAGLDDTKVGSTKKDDPAKVAQDGYDALMADKDHVVAGSVKNKIFTAEAKVLPQTVSAEKHRKMSEPGSAKK